MKGDVRYFRSCNSDVLLDSEILRCKFELILAAIVPQWITTADQSLTRCFAVN